MELTHCHFVHVRQTAGRRAGLIKENPGIAFGEVGKKLGAEWKELSDAKKKPYQDTAAKSKVGAYSHASLSPSCTFRTDKLFDVLAAYDKKKAAYDAKK